MLQCQLHVPASAVTSQVAGSGATSHVVPCHSGQHYSDVRNLENCSNSNKIITPDKENTPNFEIETKLEQLIKLREEKIETSKEDLEFIEKQNSTLLEIEESKRKVNEERNKLYLS